ncbi:MAG: helix-turn-helix transcriptional regulator [Lentisphaerae bacterium]|nr:helix-turn-helix transcriptional regulator [Lentisphaerota bacterium]
MYYTNKRTAKYVREVRVKSGLTLEKLAEKMGYIDIPRGVWRLSMFELDGVCPWYFLPKLIELLGMDEVIIKGSIGNGKILYEYSGETEEAFLRDSMDQVTYHFAPWTSFPTFDSPENYVPGRHVKRLLWGRWFLWDGNAAALSASFGLSPDNGRFLIHRANNCEEKIPLRYLQSIELGVEQLSAAFKRDVEDFQRLCDMLPFPERYILRVPAIGGVAGRLPCGLNFEQALKYVRDNMGSQPGTRDLWAYIIWPMGVKSIWIHNEKNGPVEVCCNPEMSCENDLIRVHFPVLGKYKIPEKQD